MKDMKAFFVYGTLKVGGCYARTFDKLRKKVQKGKIKGTMFNVHNNYPAVVAGDDEIHGEVHYYDDESDVTRRMDMIEGYFGSTNKNTNLYNHATVEVELDDGSFVKASTYLFNRSTENLSKVADGVWDV